MVTIDELVVGDEPLAWAALGFPVKDGACVLGDVRIRMAGAGEGLTSWSLRGHAGGDLDGLPTERSERSGLLDAPRLHANFITAVDHVVAISPDLDRTIAALEGAGLDLRRVREEPTPAGAPRQAFFRLGAVILEVAQEPPEAIEHGGGADRPAFFWGLALLSEDLETTVEMLGKRVGEIRPAVQPGRWIATLRRSAGLSVPVALMTPPPPRA